MDHMTMSGSSLDDEFDRIDRFIMEMSEGLDRPVSETILTKTNMDDDLPESEERPNTTKSRLLATSALSQPRLARTPARSQRYEHSVEEDEGVNSLPDNESSDSFLITELRESDNIPESQWDSLGIVREQTGVSSFSSQHEDDDEYDTDLDIEDQLKEHDPTGRTVYAEVCERLGVVPVSYFSRHIRDPVIVMRHHGLGPGGARAIAKILKSNVTCEKIDLSANWIEGGGGRHMAKVFKENDYINDVSLADNRLFSEGAEHICKMLHDNCTIRNLDLSGNGFTDKDATIWAEAMEENKYCKQLNLSRNYFGDEGGVILGPAISSNDILEHLDLSWNQIRQRGGVAVARGLKENIRIKVCNLSWNGLGTRGGAAIADALIHNEALVELDISGNRIDSFTSESIVKSASKNELLQILKIGCNPISTSACVTMLNYITKSEISVLEMLDLTDVPVEYNYLKCAVQLKKIRPSFTDVHGPVMRSGNTQADVGKPGINPELITNPLLVLREHIVISDTKVMDLLQKYDTEHTYTVTKDEFSTALQEMGVPLEREQLNDISERLAKNDDGKIYYGDVLKRLQTASGRVTSPEDEGFTFGYTKSPRREQ